MRLTIGQDVGDVVENVENPEFSRSNDVDCVDGGGCRAVLATSSQETSYREDASCVDKYEDCAGFPSAEYGAEMGEDSELAESRQPFLAGNVLDAACRGKNAGDVSWRHTRRVRLRQLIRRLRWLLERLAGGQRSEDRVGKTFCRAGSIST
jgi:hypothetical protein